MIGNAVRLDQFTDWCDVRSEERVKFLIVNIMTEKGISSNKFTYLE